MSFINTQRASYNRVNPNIRIGSKKPKNIKSLESDKEVLSFPEAKLYVSFLEPVVFPVTEYTVAILQKSPYSGAEIFTAKEIITRILQGKPLSLTRNGVKCLVKKV